MPFCVLTTVVFSPIERLQLRRELSQAVRLHAEEDDIDGAGFAQVADDARAQLRNRRPR